MRNFLTDQVCATLSVGEVIYFANDFSINNFSGDFDSTVVNTAVARGCEWFLP